MSLDVACLGKLNNYPDQLTTVFSFLDTRTNVEITLVCKKWCEIASKVAKTQFIEMSRNDLQTKSANFLRMANGKLEDYFPIFKEIKAEINTLSVKAVYEKVKDLTTQQLVSLSGYSTWLIQTTPLFRKI